MIQRYIKKYSSEAQDSIGNFFFIPSLVMYHERNTRLVNEFRIIDKKYRIAENPSPSLEIYTVAMVIKNTEFQLKSAYKFFVQIIFY